MPISSYLPAVIRKNLGCAPEATALACRCNGVTHVSSDWERSESRHWACFLQALGLVFLLLIPVSARAGQAHADSVQGAQAEATALRLQLASLQRKAGQAVERYDLAQGELGQLVTVKLSLQRDLATATAHTATANEALDQRARALYQAGGMAGLYASVLDSGSFTEAVGRTGMVSRILKSDKNATVAATAAGSRLAFQGQRAAEAADRQTRKISQVAVLADTVGALLAQQQALVDTADSHVLELVRAQQARAAADSADRFAAAVRAAGSSTAAGWAATDLPVPSAMIASVIDNAKKQLGKPYVWGAVGPDSFDCSGFTGWAYAAAGISMPRTAAQQYLTGSHPGLAQLAPGDLLFWATDLSNYASIDHMAMYLGAGLMIVAPHTGDVVKIQRVRADGYFGATRVNPAMSGSVAGPQWAQFSHPS